MGREMPRALREEVEGTHMSAGVRGPYGGAPLSPENNGKPLKGWGPGEEGRRASDVGFNKIAPGTEWSRD